MNTNATTIRNQYGREIDYTFAVSLMDDQLRELLHASGAYASEQEFYDAYCDLHRKTFEEEFELNKENPTF